MAIDRTISRRGLVSGAAAALAGGYVGLRRAKASGAKREIALVSAARIDGIDGGAVVAEGRLMSFPLPGRAHGLLRLRDGAIALIGRRPGRFAAIVDPVERDDDEPLRIFDPIRGSRFAGHAALSPDGSTLATSEIDAESGEGSVVLRDARTGAARERFPAGIEPHDLLFARGGARLVVAVGGIAHAADVKGPAINAGNIDSFIAELDPRSGTELNRHSLPAGMKSLSLRHMALSPSGDAIVFGMQDQDRSRLRPLIGLIRVGGALELLPMPEDAGAFRAYIGSVAIDASGRYAAATSPKGGIVGLWRLADGHALGGYRLADVCGLAAAGEAGAFWATSGYGDVVKLRAQDSGLVADMCWRAEAAFDNHLLRI